MSTLWRCFPARDPNHRTPPGCACSACWQHVGDLVALQLLEGMEFFPKDRGGNSYSSRSTHENSCTYGEEATFSTHSRTSTRPDSVGVCDTGCLAMHQLGHTSLFHASPKTSRDPSDSAVTQIGSGTGFTWNGTNVSGQSVQTCSDEQRQE